MIKSWWHRQNRFCEYLDEHHAGWREGLELIPVEDLDDQVTNWRRTLKHLFAQGMKFRIENCQSFWFVHTQKSKWAGIEGEHTLTELCYVSLFGDTFSGHATEYFDPRRVDCIRYALQGRMNLGLTTKPSGIGVSVEEAIAETQLEKEKEAA
jgi:hypothetical protein